MSEVNRFEVGYDKDEAIMAFLEQDSEIFLTVARLKRPLQVDIPRYETQV